MNAKLISRTLIFSLRELSSKAEDLILPAISK